MQTDNDGMGHFWLPDHPEVRLAGTFKTHGRRPEVEVIGGFNPVHHMTREPSGEISMSDPDLVENLVIHGDLIAPPRRITVVGGRRADSYGFFEAEYERIQGRHVIIGAHLQGATEEFSAFQVRVSGIEQWFSVPRTKLGLNHDTRFVQLTWNGKEATTMELSSGSLTVNCVATAPDQTISLNSAIKEQAWLVWTPKVPWTLERFLSEVARPLRTLMTLIYGDECPIEELKVFRPDEAEWFEVRGEGICGYRDAGQRRQLLRPSDLHQELVGYWLESFPKLSPLPQIVASSMNGHVNLLEVNALILCTAVEGLHKRLYPGQQITGTKKDGTPFQRNPYFKERLQSTLSDTARYIPEIANRSEEWLSFVTDVRNVQAHQYVDGPRNDMYLRRMIAAADILRWVLIVRMVQDAGLDEAIFTNRIKDDGHYRQLQLNVAKFEPDLASLRQGDGCGDGPAMNHPKVALRSGIAGQAADFSDVKRMLLMKNGR